MGTVVQLKFFLTHSILTVSVKIVEIFQSTFISKKREQKKLIFWPGRGEEGIECQKKRKQKNIIYGLETLNSIKIVSSGSPGGQRNTEAMLAFQV